MSAWVVSKQHIDYMVTAAIAAEHVPGRHADALGRMLWRECLRSVTYRYPNDPDGGRPGPCGFRDGDVERYQWTETPALAAGPLAKTLACYRYQSCEHPTWETSAAYELVEALMPALSKAEYERALDDDTTPWGW